MVRPVRKEVEELEGEEITCPLCRSEQVTLRTTKDDGALTSFCARQRSPFFLNEPGKIDDELLPDQEESGGDKEGEEDQEESEEDETEMEQESNPWEPDNSDDESEEIGEELLDPSGGGATEDYEI